MNLQGIFDTSAPVVGMVHLPPLPGAPGFRSREHVRVRALADARALESGGVDGLLVENFGDVPFYPDAVPRHAVAELTATAKTVADAVDLPVGVNVLRNDAESALSVAAAVGGQFVRINCHVGAVVTDQGPLAGRAYETLRLRDRIDADVAVLADVGVKHAAPLVDRPFEERVSETVERGLANGIVVSGPATGAETPLERLRVAGELGDEHGVPVFAGSGVVPETVMDVFDAVDGAIIGTALKEDGEVGNPVDEDQVRRLVERVQEIRRDR